MRPEKKNDNDLLDSAARIFRERLPSNPRFQALSGGGSQVATVPVGFADVEVNEIDLRHTLRLSRSTELAAARIGDMPPEPPTVRGQIGAVLVQAVRRALFWYTSQIRTFQQMVAEAAREQIAGFQDLAARQQRQQVLFPDVLRRLGESEQRLRDLEQEKERSSASFLEQIASQERQIRELRQSQEELREAQIRRLREAQEELTKAQSRQLQEQAELNEAQNRQLREAQQQLSETQNQQLQEAKTEIAAAQATLHETQIRHLQEAQEAWRNELQQGLVAIENTLSARAAQIDAQLTQIRHAGEEEGREVRRQMQQERTRLLQQEFRLKMLLREVRKGAPAEVPAAAVRAAGEQLLHRNDALFVEHAAAFRGDRTEIKSRLAAYTPYVKEAFAAAGGAAALDIGCGRGEWLELLGGLNIPATGIDWNRDLVQACCELGLDARQREIPDALEAIPDASLSIVTAFHVLEHISFADLLDVIDHAVRILKPGGVAIFETPNPRNLFVSSNSFYLDPTHRHPLPSEFLSFVIEARGLCDLRVLPSSPYPDHFHLAGSECPAVQFINDHFFGAQDYGIVAYKV